MESSLRFLKKIIPQRLYVLGQPLYHRILAIAGAVIYRFPSRKIKVIGVTGTKGKSSTVEILSAILEEAGYTTAASNTIRFKIGKVSVDNKYKMSMPGRAAVQRFIRQAVSAKIDFAIIEMTSQGALMSRHLYIEPDAIIVTNVSPEHIEAHGSFEAYIGEKIKIAKTLETSKKPRRILVVNRDDEHKDRFLAVNAPEKKTYSAEDGQPYSIKKEGIDFTWKGTPIASPLSGRFNLYNMMAAISCAEAYGVDASVIKRALEKFNGIRGRVEKIEVGQDFTVIVDYAHTTDSLEKLYQVFQNSRKIAVLGGTGGGRDKARRKEMGSLADRYCEEVILTNEDPYDEDPTQIINDVAAGVTTRKPVIVFDRREAIRTAISKAQTGDIILITGKGTDPYIMGADNSKIPWDDATVAREELQSRLQPSPIATSLAS
ncbi:MAG: UDP-N-acetylmuramyl-tripeptide synthetase [Patescibacteria group bacterium]